MKLLWWWWGDWVVHFGVSRLAAPSLPIGLPGTDSVGVSHPLYVTFWFVGKPSSPHHTCSSLMPPHCGLAPSCSVGTAGWREAASTQNLVVHLPLHRGGTSCRCSMPAHTSRRLSFPVHFKLVPHSPRPAGRASSHFQWQELLLGGGSSHPLFDQFGFIQATAQEVRQAVGLRHGACSYLPDPSGVPLTWHFPSQALWTS